MHPTFNSPEITQDLFNEEDIFTYEEATTGQRFLNFLIDALGQWLLSALIGLLLGMALYAASPDIFNEMFVYESYEVTLLSYAVSITSYILYYFISEKAFKGKTLGKLITRTKAVNTDGSPLSTKSAFLRSISRLVPFEPFSALSGSPWHDTWTKTMVIKNR